MSKSILHDPVEMTVNTIYVPLESYLYLQAESHRQCSERGPEMPPSKLERLCQSFERFSYNGEHKLMDGYLCGCHGDPHNAWEEGRWTSWSVRDMASMLDEQGLPYRLGKPEKVIRL